MAAFRKHPLTRRSLLLSAGAAALAAAGPPWPRPEAAPVERRLVAAAGRQQLIGAPRPDTAVWCYNGQVPGPEIRVRQGERVRVTVENRLEEETTLHWHGVRVANAMDGVPHLTQKPIAPGETFVYEFDVPDAGTYWYHPHQKSFEQVDRGLYGVLVVEEREPIRVDRDVTWVLDDWRLTKDGNISDDFASFFDVSHAGRIGNTVTVNGRVPDRFQARAGERLRLRLVNVANARIFGLEFEGHAPQVIAIDGQPVAPHAPGDGRVVLAPGMRIDLALDMSGPPGASFKVSDSFYRRFAYRLLDIVYADEPALPAKPGDASIALPANTMPEPDEAGAERHAIRFEGGMMGGMREARMDGRLASVQDIMRHGMAWSVNGAVATGHVHEPLLTLERGKSYVFALDNDTAWHHPIHLHGHAFRVVARDGRPTRHREWQDTVLMAPKERVDIAFVADNPGDWMLHCHVLEHQSGGMMGVVRVA